MALPSTNVVGRSSNTVSSPALVQAIAYLLGSRSPSSNGSSTGTGIENTVPEGPNSHTGDAAVGGGVISATPTLRTISPPAGSAPAGNVRLGPLLSSTMPPSSGFSVFSTVAGPASTSSLVWLLLHAALSSRKLPNQSRLVAASRDAVKKRQTAAQSGRSIALMENTHR